MPRSPRADEEPLGGRSHRVYRRGATGGLLHIDDTEELLGGRDYILTTPDAILYCDGRVYIFGRARQYMGAHVNILARASIFGRVTSIFGRVTIYKRDI